MRAGGEGRRLALIGALAALVAAGWLLVEALSPGPQQFAYTVDRATGEVWACANGVCQTND